MIKNTLIYSLLFIVFISACGSKKNKPAQKENDSPKVTNNGNTISFLNEESIGFFETETVKSRLLDMEITAPAKVSATVIKSEEGASQNIILFENPQLAGNYTQLIQHLININQIRNINIKQKKLELARIQDLKQHGAATGQDLIDAQTSLSIEETNLANEQAAIIEHETQLKAAGFSPEKLRNSKAGTAYIICDIPENQISKIKVGSICTLEFNAFPNEKMNGKIDGIADMIDQTTRMVKLRISTQNNGDLKAGMFAIVSFGLNEGNAITIDKNSLITIQGKNYVFVKKNNTVFERREVYIGTQVNDRIIVYKGLENGEAVAMKGVMQLKGLSFGY